MQIIINSISIILVFSLFLGSCSELQDKHYEVTPSSYGKPNSIMLVTDNYNWTTAIGDSFKQHFEALYPVTPQEEPIYDVRQTSPLEFNETKIFKTHRAIIIIAALDDQNDLAATLIRKTLGEENVKRATTDPTYRMAIHKDRWASGQLVVYWFAPNRGELLQTITNDYQKVMDEINREDTKLYMAQLYVSGENHDVSKMFEKEFGIQIKIPREFILAHKDSVGVWLRRETDKVSSNIFIYKLPYSDSTTATAEHHRYIRNKLTKEYFSTWVDSSYMQIDDRVLPLYFQPMQIAGKPTLQVRGLWGMVNDFMGGSFVSYMIEDKANNQVILLDGFVHAPGQKKRPEMRRLDMVFSTFDIIDK